MKDFIKNNRLAKLAIFIVLASAIFASCKRVIIKSCGLAKIA